MRKGTLHVELYKQGGTHRVPIGAYFAEGAPGLGIHRLVNPATGMLMPDGGWRITHAGTGRALDTRTFRTRKAALACAQVLGKITDWRLSVDTLRDDSDLQAMTRYIIGSHIRAERENRTWGRRNA